MAMFKTKPLTIPCQPLPDPPSSFQKEQSILRMPTSITLVPDEIIPPALVRKNGQRKPTEISSPRKENVVIDVVGQYNNIIGRKDVNLTFRRLPPVKLSFQPSSKSKFMASPTKGEMASRILKPHLGQSTCSAAHHIFTEGISRSSEVPHPSFALPTLKVPYSNLPDNVSIFKEKNQFAFAVRNEENIKSPYRLAPLAGDQLDIGANDDDVIKDPSKDERCLTEVKSNIVKLEPIISASDHASSPRTSRMACPPKYGSPPPSTSRLKNGGNKKRLSIVSIGDTVSESVDEINKREMRKLYPMYDNQARKNDYFNRDRVKNLFERGTKPKPKPNNSTFTYRVSFDNFKAFVDSSPSQNSKPIKNNLHEMRRHRGDSRMKRGDSEYTMYSDFSAHRPSRMLQAPKSAESRSSGAVSVIPPNPPPSIISHIVSDDFHHIPTDQEPRNELLTLLEERTLTASVYSVPERDVKSGLMRLETLDQGDEARNDEEDSICDNKTDTDIQLNSIASLNKQDSPKRPKEENLVEAETENESEQWGDGKGAEMNGEQSQSLGEQVETDFINQEQDMNDMNIGTCDSSSPTFKKDEGLPPKQQLKLPTHQLDIASNPPLSSTRERTSMSRLLENTTVSKEVTTAKFKSEESIVEKAVVSVQKLRLFPNSESPCSQKGSEDEDLVVVNPDTVLLADRASSVRTKSNQISSTNGIKSKSSSGDTKKVVNSANIAFISPLVNSDKRAKRQ